MKADVHARLRPAVLRAFSRGDFHNVDMRSIAAECGISFATIYKYFGDKEHLLFWYVSECLTELRQRVESGIAGLESAKEKLRRCLWINLDYYEHNPDVGRAIFMSVPLQTWMRDATYVQAGFFTSLQGLVREAQRDGLITSDVHPNLVIDLFIGIIQRSVIMWEYRNRAYRLTDQFEGIFRLVWNGCAVAPAEGDRPAGARPHAGSDTAPRRRSRKPA